MNTFLLRDLLSSQLFCWSVTLYRVLKLTKWQIELTTAVLNHSD